MLLPFGNYALAQSHIELESATKAAFKGPIDEAAYQDFSGFIKGKSIRTLSLNSGGGDVYYALKIASIVQEKGIQTVVESGDICLSACFYLFVSGENRTSSGEVGVHQFYNPAGNQGNLEQAQNALHQINGIFIDAKLSPLVFQIMISTPPDTMHVFNNSELTQLNIANLGNQQFVRRNELDKLRDNRITIKPKPFDRRYFLSRTRNTESQFYQESLINLSIEAEYIGNQIKYKIYVGAINLDLNGDVTSVDFQHRHVFDWIYDFEGNLMSFDIVDPQYYSIIKQNQTPNMMLYYYALAAQALTSNGFAAANFGKVIETDGISLGYSDLSTIDQNSSALFNSRAFKYFIEKYDSNGDYEFFIVQLLQLMKNTQGFEELMQQKARIRQFEYREGDILVPFESELATTLSFNVQGRSIQANVSGTVSGAINLTTGLATRLKWLSETTTDITQRQEIEFTELR